MSGPIVRKYGFPNHESIFGKKEIEHGVDDGESEAPATATQPGKAEKKATTKKAAPKKAAPKKKG
jgi:hypothetical protein